MRSYFNNFFKYLFLIILFIILHTIPSFALADLISYKYGFYYSSNDLFNLSNKLAERYNDILEIEIIGKSTDGKPIYVIKMTDDIENYEEEDYVNKMHLLVEAGLHSRETYNSFVLIKMIEDYSKDYYEENTLADINIKELLKNNVIHFIVCSNPDGYDLTKFGISSIKNKSVEEYLIKNVNSKNYKNFKSNLRGVDLNRNFKDIYYNSNLKGWVNQWNVNYVKPVSYHPSSQFYSGPSANSEAETKIISNYFLKYDFRAYLSYHSQGRVVYYHQGHLFDKYNDLTKDYSIIVSNITNYTLLPPDGIIGYGYSSYFAANNTLKPFVTVETTIGELPTSIDFYKSEYENRKLYKIPAEFIKKNQEVGYWDYKIYVNGIYVRDIMDKEYAYALAEKLNGIVVDSKGTPPYSLSKTYNLKLYCNPLVFKTIIIKKSFSETVDSTPNISTTINNKSEVIININDMHNTNISLIVNKLDN